MNVIKPLTQTRDTITLKRADFDALVRSADDAIDLAAVEAHRAYEDRVGWETARRNYLTADEARRLLGGESPVRVWRMKRGIKQRTLAEAAEVAPSYLAEIEGGKKPGSPGALQRIASVLEMPLEPLVNAGRASPGLQPVSRAETIAKRLITRAEIETDPDALAMEARTMVNEWRNVGERLGALHQVKAAIEALAHRVAGAHTDCLTEASELERIGDKPAHTQRQNMSRALGAVLDKLSEERGGR